MFFSKPNLLKGVYQMGFNAPSKIQEMALPTLLADPCQNLIAQAQSGTGKTAAFVLAMLSRVDPEKHYPQVKSQPKDGTKNLQSVFDGFPGFVPFANLRAGHPDWGSSRQYGKVLPGNRNALCCSRRDA